MSRWARLAVIVALAAVVIVPAILYISDALVLRYRLGRGGGRDTITVYFRDPTEERQARGLHRPPAD